MTATSRRGFLIAGASFIAAPAIIRATSLEFGLPSMIFRRPFHWPNGPVTIDMLTKETLRLFRENNAFLRSLNS